MNLPVRRSRRDDETGSMAVYLMIAIMGVAIGALLVPMVISQTRTTRLDTTRVHALDAAQAGIDAMLGQIRAAKTTDEVGTSSLLPCTSTSGTVNGSDDAAYTVRIDYYMADPVATPTAVKMRCVPGYGTYDPVTDNFTPKFARITSTGTDGVPVNGGTRGRTLVTTYIFRTTNSNIPGGRIRLYPAPGSSAQLCMDGTTATPTAGTILKLQTCTDPLATKQVFAYRSDLTIQLLSSITGTYKAGLCLDETSTPVAGKVITLTACRAQNDALLWTQQWSFNDDGHLESSKASTATDGVLSNICLNVASQNAGLNVTLENCSGSTGSPTQAWIPAPSVGAGAAEAPQLINYYEFGRCLDVTNQQVGSDHLIDFPCKQNPYPAAVRWNQKFVTPGIAANASSAVGQIVTPAPSGNNCLTSPGVAGGLVVVRPCASGAAQVWTVYNGSSALVYRTKYTIVDSGGRCLGLTDPAAGEAWSAIDVEPCDGATEHKWNATANLNSSVLQDLDEIPTP
jgi:type II secretory pathway pseudopilin PulG